MPAPRDRPRARTLSVRQLLRVIMAEPVIEIDEPRPKTRAECIGAERPCPWVGCRYHLYLDVNHETGSIKFNYPDRDVDEIPQTCALDVADHGGATLEEIGAFLGITRERARQIEVHAAMQVRAATHSDPP